MSGAGAAGLDCAAVDTLELTGRSLAVEDVERVALGEVRVALGTLAADRVLELAVEGEFGDSSG